MLAEALALEEAEAEPHPPSTAEVMAGTAELADEDPHADPSLDLTAADVVELEAELADDDPHDHPP